MVDDVCACVSRQTVYVSHLYQGPAAWLLGVVGDGGGGGRTIHLAQMSACAAVSRPPDACTHNRPDVQDAPASLVRAGSEGPSSEGWKEHGESGYWGGRWGKTWVRVTREQQGLVPRPRKRKRADFGDDQSVLCVCVRVRVRIVRACQHELP